MEGTIEEMGLQTFSKNVIDDADVTFCVNVNVSLYGALSHSALNVAECYTAEKLRLEKPVAERRACRTPYVLLPMVYILSSK